MGVSNSWAEFAAVFLTTRSAFLDHEKAKTELKGLMPEDAKEAFGHGIRAKRSKSGAVSFEVLDEEAEDSPPRRNPGRDTRPSSWCCRRGTTRPPETVIDGLEDSGGLSGVPQSH
jgi:hypothetical protein